jgi:hypothetical protein
MRARRIAINLPPPIHDYVKALAERRGISVTAAICAVIGEHMDAAPKAAKPQPKKEK